MKGLVKLYDIPRNNITFNTTALDDIKEICFNSAYTTGDKNVDTVHALLYPGSSNEGVVFVHGLGDRNIDYLKFYPENLSKHGYTTIMPILPYHLTRIPQHKSISFLSGTAADIEKRFCQSVVDVLTCVDYLESLGLSKIHIMGFSFGGMISTIALSIDKRINKGIFAVAGGNFEYITWKSTATKVLRIRYEDEDSCSPEKCHELHKSFDDQIKSFHKLEDLNLLPDCFRYDPSLYAKFIDPKNILMFSSIFDPFIPKKSSDDLWTRLKNPKRYLLPSGHLTAHLLFKHFILKKSLIFLQKNTSKD